MKPKANGYEKTLNQVRQLLDSGKVAEAKDVLLRASSRPPELQNALGVCWLRLGETGKALDLYRSMVLYEGGVCFRQDAPAIAMTNYATALLLSGNIAGCEAVLEANNKGNTLGAARLREAITRWKRSLGPLRKLMVALNGPPYDARVKLDFPPGEI